MPSDVRVGGEKRLPLSFAQRGNWAAQRLFPGSAGFCVCDLVWFDRDIDAEAFADAVSGAFAETEALRAVVVVDDDGVPSQVVGEALSLRTVVPGELFTDEEVRSVVRAGVGAREFPAGADVTSSTLFRRAAGGWVWSFTTNNLLLDGYSMSLYIRRVAEIYSAAVDGTPAPARWFGRLEDLVAGSASTPGGSAVVGHWRDVLAVDVFSEPAGGMPADLFSFSYRPVPVVLPPDADDHLRLLARQMRSTWTDAVITAWGLYTALAGGRDCLAVRVPSMMRGAAESLRVPGAVARALPVVTVLRPSASFAEVLSVVGSQVRDLKDNSAIEDHQLARLWTGGERSYLALPSVNIKIFRSAPVFGTVPGVTELINPGPTGALDLSVYGSPGRGLRMNVSGRSPLVPEDAADRHAAAFGLFLGHLLSGPADRTLHDLAELTTTPSSVISSSTDVVSVEAVSTEAVSVGVEMAAPALTVDGLVRDQVVRSPGAVAVVDDTGGGEWGYAGFDARVNALAHLLAEGGVVVGGRVAVALPRSADLVVALAAVLRAGAAYVPLDPRYPAERMTAILADSAARVVVTDAATAAAHAGVFTAVNVATVVLDEDAVRGRLEHGTSDGPALSRPVTPEDTAYVIFTSGTTGRPKGVAVSHAAVVNRLLWGREALGFSPADRVLLKTPFTFDVSVPEFFLPLIVGGVIVVARDGSHGDPDYIAGVLRRQRITSVHFVPSMLQAFLDSGAETGSFPDVRLVSFTGEALPVAAALGAREVFDRAELFNLYGPTEAAVEIASYGITQLHADAGSTPIGRPVFNSYVRVLDGWLRPVPAGVTGELYLGGVQLADGYAGRAGLTAERFVADPHGAPDTRLYRTGDLARWNGHGELEYLGRTDDQVKVRGFRIELDEIRTALERHPTVSGAAVTALDHPAGGKYLAAYITTSPTAPSAPVDQAALAEVLRDHTTTLLPEYMVPTSFTHLDALPTAPSGKLDRKALPTPDLTAGSGGGRAPETNTELSLAAVFRDVLALPDGTPLSADDDFFRLGGDSILAIRLVARASKRQHAFTLRDVFEQRTVAKLSKKITQEVEAKAMPASNVAVPASPTLERLRESRDDPNSWVLTETAVLPIRLSHDAILAAYTSLVQAHDLLRLSVQTVSRRLWLTWANPMTTVAPTVSRLHLADAPPATKLTDLRAMASQLIDITDARPSGLAYASTSTQTYIALAVHAAAADRYTVHQLLKALRPLIDANASKSSPSAPSVAATLSEVADIAAALETDQIANQVAVIERTGSLDETLYSAGRARVIHWYGTRTDATARETIRRTLHATGYGSRLGGAVDHESPLLPAADLRPLGPMTATVPVPIEQKNWQQSPGVALARYGSGSGRRRLAGVPIAPILVSRSYSANAESLAIEPTEAAYRAVIRYRVQADSTVLTVIGLTQAVTLAFENALSKVDDSTDR
ncbi:amino acid adenylation domain-containing protein [Parafrankia sp. FMc2]